jgi:hypothetical protein
MTNTRKTNNPRNWQYTGDVSPEEYGGKWFRQVAPKIWQIIELTNMNEACGRDNEGYDTYFVELSLVDLNAIPDKEIQSARESCDIPDDALESWLAVGCYEYGLKAPLESWSGPAFGRLLRAARSAAHSLRRDHQALADRMERPVNAIGSTATEYMAGDISSVVMRGVANGDPKAELMLKLGVGR